MWPHWWDRGTETVRDVIFSGKFNSMFSMLFAVGFTIQLGRLQAREPERATRIYLRRLFWLFVFGVVHACVFWAGDVLHMYAVLGLLLLALRRVPDRAIVALIVRACLYPTIIGTIRMATATPEDIQAIIAVTQQAITADNAAFGHGNFLDTARRSTEAMIIFYEYPLRAGHDPRATSNSSRQCCSACCSAGIAFSRTSLRSCRWFAARSGGRSGSAWSAAVAFMVWRSVAANPMEPSVWRILAATGYVVVPGLDHDLLRRHDRARGVQRALAPASRADHAGRAGCRSPTTCCRH